MKQVPETIEDFIGLFREKLGTLYGSREAENLSYLAVCKVLNFPRRVDVSLNRLLRPDQSQKQRLFEVLQNLLSAVPIQYVFGNSEFYGLTLKVDENVLIPRPETEEMVHLIIRNNVKDNPLILDIGTGSGCIAIALKKNIPGADVFAVDVSEKALEIAKQNADINGTAVNFIKADVLKETPSLPGLPDIVVSNPPYVLYSEKDQLHQNVVNFEPHQALFVTNERPLIFYEVIAAYAEKNLSPEGKLYFEINERYGPDMEKLLAGLGFKNILLKKDLNNKDRIIIAFN